MPTEIKIVVPMAHDDETSSLVDGVDGTDISRDTVAAPEVELLDRYINDSQNNGRQENCGAQTPESSFIKHPDDHTSHQHHQAHQRNLRPNLQNNQQHIHQPNNQNNQQHNQQPNHQNNQQHNHQPIYQINQQHNHQQHHNYKHQHHHPQLHQQELTLPLDQTQLNLTTLTADYNVVLDRGQTRGGKTPASSPRLGHRKNQLSREQSAHHEPVRLSVTETYDLDVEHRDIMAKALRSYSRHRYGERVVGEGSEDSQTDTGDCPPHPTPPVINGESMKKIAHQTLNAENTNLTRNFKLSLCRLRFHDDDDADDSPPLVNQGKGPSLAFKRKPLLSPTRPLVTPVPTLYQLEESDGIIADSVGHVYKPKRIRPWTALPGKFIDLVKINTRATESRRSSDDQSSRCASVSSIRPSTSRPVSRRQSVPLPGAKTNIKVAQPKMSDHPPHSMAYQKRNRTTHMWTDGSQLMSTSLPSSSFLHRQFASSASSSPRSSRDATSEKASPAGKSATARPSSSYSYDGGFFVGAHAGQAEYFVIHPDWVSEAVTIKKLSIGSKTNGPPVSKSASFRNWGGRRCMSAPPAKRRNPITWDQSEPIDIQERRY